MIKKVFKIEGMHCTSCALLIDSDLEDLAGVKNANTSFARQTTEVEYDPEKITETDILESIKKTGYRAA